MHALIDGDILLYEFGSASREDGNPIPWAFVVSRLDSRIANILNTVSSDTHQLYLTGEGNYRKSDATIKPYKGHRPSEKPYWYEHIWNFLVAHRGAEVVKGIEADDAMGIAQSGEETIICSRDKDLKMIPGWHYSWPSGSQPEKGPWWQTEEEGTRFFYQQLLTGDPTDNIPGLYNVGNSSALVKQLKDMDSELEMYKHVRTQYEKRFGSYWTMFLHENARLLWIQREEDEDVRDRLTKLEEEYQNETVDY